MCLNRLWANLPYHSACPSLDNPVAICKARENKECMKKNLIVFDIDGTLIDSASVHGEFIEISMRNQGIKDIDTNWHLYKHHTDSFIIQENLFRNGIKTDSEFYIDKIDRNLLDLYNESETVIQPFTGLLELFQDLNNDSVFDYCFATGSLRKSAEFKMSKSLPQEYFLDRLFSASEGITREQIVSSAIDSRLRNNKIDNFDRIISIGDGIWDRDTAHNLNIEFIPVGPAENFDRFKSDCFFHLDHEQGLAILLDKISGAPCS